MLLFAWIMTTIIAFLLGRFIRDTAMDQILKAQKDQTDWWKKMYENKFKPHEPPTAAKSATEGGLCGKPTEPPK